MPLRSAALALLAALTFSGTAHAQEKVLKWGAAGDVQSIDPDTINETLTNNLNNPGLRLPGRFQCGLGG